MVEKKTKLFDGKRFKFVESVPNQRVAKPKVSKLRKKGYYVRVIEVHPVGIMASYHIYKRKK